MNIYFEEGNIESISSVIEMMRDFYSSQYYKFDETITSQNLQEFLGSKNYGQLWIIKHDHEIIGYFILTLGFSFEYKGRDAFIDELFIKKNYRGKGIGNKVMTFIEEKAKELNINAIHLEVERDNDIGKKLYKKHGYIGNNRELITKCI